jgi:hypothetical protein
MGADIIGYHVLGPPKLTRSLRSKAVKRINDMKEALEEICNDEEAEDGPVPDDFIDLLKTPLFRHLSAQTEFSDLSFIREVHDPGKLVDEFMNFWDDPCFRDATSRIFTVKGQKVKVVFAGEMTWGDEPEGWGYTTLKAADYLGLFNIFKLQ